MKKLLLISALAFVAALSSSGQGTVMFANNSATRVYYELTPGSSAITFVPLGTRFAAELLYAPDGPIIDFAGRATRLGATASFSLLPGMFNGGVRTAPNISPPGGFGFFQVRVWDTEGQYGWGESPIFRVDTGDPTTDPPGTPAWLPDVGLTSFTVWTVPEPSAIALGILGAGALLILRRR